MSVFSGAKKTVRSLFREKVNVQRPLDALQSAEDAPGLTEWPQDVKSYPLVPKIDSRPLHDAVRGFPVFDGSVGDPNGEAIIALQSVIAALQATREGVDVNSLLELVRIESKPLPDAVQPKELTALECAVKAIEEVQKHSDLVTGANLVVKAIEKASEKGRPVPVLQFICMVNRQLMMNQPLMRKLKARGWLTGRPWRQALGL
jgi:hypothetical protein